MGQQQVLTVRAFSVLSCYLKLEKCDRISWPLLQVVPLNFEFAVTLLLGMLAVHRSDCCNCPILKSQKHGLVFRASVWWKSTIWQRDGSSCTRAHVLDRKFTGTASTASSSWVEFPTDGQKNPASRSQLLANPASWVADKSRIPSRYFAFSRIPHRILVKSRIPRIPFQTLSYC